MTKEKVTKNLISIILLAVVVFEMFIIFKLITE